jgi:multidrug resistance efflux pump
MSAERSPIALVTDSPPGRSRRWLLAAISLAAAAVLAYSLAHPVGGGRAGEFVARRGPLQFTVPFVGSLAPEQSETYSAEVAGAEMKILWLAEEGTLVKPGDPLVRFDPAPFQKDLENAEARVKELSEETEQARLAMASAQLTLKSDLREAEAAAANSERDLSAYVNTAAPLSVQESAHNLEQKEREAQEAQDKLKGLEPFVAQGFISQEEYRAAKGRRDQAVADLRLARAQHEALTHETAPDLLKQKMEEAQTRQLQLSLQKEKSGTQIGQAGAAYRLSQARRDEASRLRAEAERKIARCSVAARSSGLVVYGEMFDKSGERRKIRVGDAVWGGTPILFLPDLSHFLIEGRVPESEIHRLSPGQTVKARLDAFPDLELTGVVRHVGSLGTSEKSESRSFPLVAALRQADPRFRPGMIARAFVDCGRAENALYVPIEAVRTGPQGESCLVVRPFGGTLSRPVVTGRNTSQYVEVIQGLEEGDVIRVGEN